MSTETTTNDLPLLPLLVINTQQTV